MSAADDLVDVLSNMGVDVYKVIGDEVNGRCPVHVFHKGRASTRNSWYMNVDSGLYHCFTCGARGNLPYLVSQMSADPQDVGKVQQYLNLKAYERIGQEEEEEVRAEVDWKEYASFEPLPDRILKQRRLSASVAKRFGVRWNPEHKSVVLPILSPEGELWGWQEKKTGWVQNYPEGSHKGEALFGLERASSPTALLLESPLDVVRFHSVIDDGVSAVSSFGANISQRQIDALEERFSRVILALDNDAAGVSETRRLVGIGSKKHTKKRQLTLPVFFWDYKGTKAKDIGEMTAQEIINGRYNLEVVCP